MNTFFVKYLLFAAAVWMSAPIALQAQDDDIFEEEPVVDEPTTSNLYWGFKGGLTLATQKWNTFQHKVMPTYHGAFVLEYLGRWNTSGIVRRFGLHGALGYAQRGGTYRFWNINGTSRRPRDVFHNISLLVAGKGVFRIANHVSAFYGLGLRAEYSVKSNLVNIVYNPYVRPFNYGIWFAGGIEFMLSKTAVFLEVSISPDVSKQVMVPPGLFTGYNDVSGNPIYTQQEKVYNLSFELSAGIKFGKNDVQK